MNTTNGGILEGGSSIETTLNLIATLLNFIGILWTAPRNRFQCRFCDRKIFSCNDFTPSPEESSDNDN